MPPKMPQKKKKGKAFGSFGQRYVFRILTSLKQANSNPYPLAFRTPTHGISNPLPIVFQTPTHSILNPIPMVWWPPSYPWYVDPPPTHCISNHLPISWLKMTVLKIPRGFNLPYRGVHFSIRGFNIAWMKIDPEINIPWGSYDMTL